MGAVSPPVARSAPVPDCPHTAGHIQGPFVPTAAAARQVFIAIGDAVAPDAMAKHQDVVVQDEGSYWAVFQTMRVRRGENGPVVTSSGGGLSLDLDKCTGAVLRATRNR
jgi:hypothetical protein